MVIELCQEILVDTIYLANFEFFSSMVKDFNVFVSAKYPPEEDWVQLHGNFTASNRRDLQSFSIKNPKIWARYLKISFLSQYGKEHFCPISVLNVFGTTIMEDLHKTQTGFHPLEERQSGIESHVSIPQNLKNALTKSRSPPKRSFEGLESLVQSDSNLRSIIDETSSKRKFSSPALSLNEQLYHHFTSSFDFESFPASQPAEEAQESVFKTILKRVDALERNSTRYLNLLMHILDENEARLGIVYGDFNQSLSKLYHEMVCCLLTAETFQ